MGWFGGEIARRAQWRSRCDYDYRVTLDYDQSTRNIKLPLDAYDSEEGAAVWAWVLLESAQVSSSGRALTANARQINH